MCLIVNKATTLKVATRRIPIAKLVFERNGDYYTICQWVRIPLNCNIFPKGINNYSLTEKYRKGSNIGQGFIHSFPISEIKKDMQNLISYAYDGVIIGYIPKGAYYIKGHDGDIASSQIVTSNIFLTKNESSLLKKELREEILTTVKNIKWKIPTDLTHI